MTSPFSAISVPNPSPLPDPAILVASLASMDSEEAIYAAHACLEACAWDHLSALSQAGFDLSANHRLGGKAIYLEETLLYRCLRTQPAEQLAGALSALLELGASPQAPNGQGLTPLGMLINRAGKAPDPVIPACFAVFARYGVRISDPTHVGTELSSLLLDSTDAVATIAKRCPSLRPWAQALREAEMLETSTPSVSTTASSGARAPRL